MYYFEISIIIRKCLLASETLSTIINMCSQELTKQEFPKTVLPGMLISEVYEHLFFRMDN